MTNVSYLLALVNVYENNFEEESLRLLEALSSQLNNRAFKSDEVYKSCGPKSPPTCDHMFRSPSYFSQ